MPCCSTAAGPVLIAPHRTPVTLGIRVAVAWNGTGESAAAVQAALPWLRTAQAVRILSSDEYQRNGPLARDLAAYLALHGVKPEMATFRSLDREVGAGMLAAAREFGADLLTMGCLFAFPPAPADPGRRHPARAGEGGTCRC